MNIKDISWNESFTKRNNNLLLPQRSIRGIIVGKSDCGKTTLLLNLLLQPSWLDYDHLYVLGKSLHQPIYQFLQKAIQEKIPQKEMEPFDFKKEIMENAYSHQQLLSL